MALTHTCQTGICLRLQEIRKYDALVADMDKNAVAQDALLADVGRNMAAFRGVFDVEAWRRQCEGAAAGVKEVSGCSICMQCSFQCNQ